MTGTKLLFDEARIAGRVDALARDVVATIGSSFVFVADLVRALDQQGAEPRVEFMRLSSYGLARQSSGEVHLLGDIPTDMAGKRILLVDDIVDTGRSIAYAMALLRQRDAEAIWTCALVDKPVRREVDVTVDFVGFTVDDVFIAGYGIDYAERYRHLPHICAVED